jgi:CRP/FNR family transcriptional regulator, anaerobic regulatory protein
MEYDLILSNVAKHISLDPLEAEYFISRLESRKIRKKEFLLKQGQLCKTISFVNSGALRAFYCDKDLNESTIMFAITDWWITDMPCFVNQDPAIIWIEAIENSVVFELTKDDLDILFIKIPKFERFFRMLMQNSYIREQLRVLQSLSLSAEERYDRFMKKYPSIAKQVTQKNIASYLGITPEFLSTLRNKRKKGAIS